jgi:hypothetical protein
MTRQEMEARDLSLDAGFTQINQTYFAVCEANLPAALVWWAIQFRTKLDGEGDVTWLRLQDTEIQQLITYTYSLPVIAHAKRYLVKRGILLEHRGENNVLEVRLNWGVIRELVAAIAKPVLEAVKSAVSLQKNLRSERRAEEARRRAQQEPPAEAESLLKNLRSEQEQEPQGSLLKNLRTTSEEMATDPQIIENSSICNKNKNLEELASSEPAENRAARLEPRVRNLTEEMRLRGESINNQTVRNISREVAKLPAAAEERAFARLEGLYRSYHNPHNPQYKRIGWGVAFQETRAELAKLAEETPEQAQAQPRPPAAIPPPAPPSLPPVEERLEYTPEQIAAEPRVFGLISSCEETKREHELDRERYRKSPAHAAAVLPRWHVPTWVDPMLAMSFESAEFGEHWFWERYIDTDTYLQRVAVVLLQPLQPQTQTKATTPSTN